MGADMDVGWAPNVDKPKNGFDVTLHTADMAEARRWFDRLAEGGKATMPFGETFWTPGLRRARRQVRGPVDDQRHPPGRLEAGAGLRPERSRQPLSGLALVRRLS